jgi:hypothetical protein
MFPSSFYWTMCGMGICTVGFHYLFKNVFQFEKELFEKYSVNMMRSVMCLYFSLQSVSMIQDVWSDIYLKDENRLIRYQEIHYPFLSYFVFDTVLMLYQRYLQIEKKIRYDLVLHHGLAMTALLLIEKYNLYGLSVMMMMSEGMSVVSGVKLICMDFGYHEWIKPIVKYRYWYILVGRMMILWPMMLYYYYEVTNGCEKYKENRNMLLMVSLLTMIYHADIRWMYNAKRELQRI